MKSVLCPDAKSLLDSLSAAAQKFAVEAAGSSGDFSAAATAVAELLLCVRSISMNKALELSTRDLPKKIWCPCCGCEVKGWHSGIRRVVTEQGAGMYNRMRYRCQRCHKDYYPTEEANGLTGSSYTLEARNTIAAVAAEHPYKTTSTEVWETRAIPVSAKEVDTITREMAALAEGAERKLVDALFGEEALRQRVEDPEVDPLDSVPALNNMSDWSALEPALVSVDGGKIRSTQRGEKGLEWFECRAAVIASAQDDGRGHTIYLGGVAKADDIFDLLAATYRKSAGSKRQLSFVADGATWIWDRVPLYFPNAVQVLDIYHAGEHVASAAKAAWGERSQMAAYWGNHARELLLRPAGVQSVLKALLKRLREHNNGADAVVVADDLIREIRYLFGHRHRMRYAKLRENGLPIGSGAMESAIKQLSTMRLRLPGMMWTRTGADAVLRLRAAHLSGALEEVVNRRRATLKAQAERYYNSAAQCAA